MSSKKIAEFPNVEAKLQKPSKQSAFEKQRAEAEAKRAREAAETAAVLKEFEKSFDNDDDYGHGGGSRFGSSQGFVPRGPGFGGAPPGGAGRRHFGTSALKSGPGSLGPAPNSRSGPGSLGPPPGSYGKKRGFDSFRQERDRDGRLGPDDRGEPLPVSRAFHNSDDEEAGHSDGRADEVAVARPTLRLSNVPPGTSQAMIKSLMPTNLTVENVKMVPANGPATERKSTVAIVTLSQETPATDMDATVSALQHRYLGYGFYLSLHRHLSSAVTSSLSAASLVTSSTSQPFGAKPVSQKQPQSNAVSQQAFHRGFAPPTSYGPNNGGPVNRASLLHVPVNPPSDVKMLQLINKTIESVLEHGPEFEALLMTRSEVQQEEKWAWIWDARSEGGIWYRWRLWEIVTGADAAGKKGRYLPLFDGSHAWKAPEKGLAFEYTTKIDEFVSDSEYNSSDQEDEDNEAGQDQKPGQEVDMTFLNPLDKAKLTHLLSRLPTTLSRIRKGDIARVTTFALTHASRGAEEVVDMIVSNVAKPFALSTANPEYQPNRDKGKQGDTSEPAEAEAEEKADRDSQDYSAASLVGLYVVSDILSSSSTSGIRHAWRFRQTFESALKDRRTFETLGLMATKLRWGRLKAEKWKRSVGMILNLWEGWCVFPVETQELFTGTFENPPSAKAEEEPSELAKKGKWKTVDVSTPSSLPISSVVDDVEGEPMEEDDDADGVPMEDDDVEGEPLVEDDVDGEPMEEDDVEGEPMEDSDMDGDAKVKSPGQSPNSNLEAASAATIAGNVERASDPAATHSAGAAQVSSKPAGPGPRGKRMRAVDMFVDSGASDEGN